MVPAIIVDEPGNLAEQNLRLKSVTISPIFKIKYISLCISTFYLINRKKNFIR